MISYSAAGTGAAQSKDLFRYTQTGVDENGKVQGTFAPTGDLPTFFAEFKAKGIEVPSDIFKVKQEGK